MKSHTIVTESAYELFDEGKQLFYPNSRGYLLEIKKKSDIDRAIKLKREISIENSTKSN
jgi:hypothetical protein